MNARPLSSLQPGERGLLTGTPLEVVRYAPLGDPVEIRVRGYHLSLRRHEADRVMVREP